MFKNGLYSLVQFYVRDDLQVGDEILGTSFQHVALTHSVGMSAIDRIVPHIQDSRFEGDAELKRLIGVGLIENNTRNVVRQEFAQIERRSLTIDVLYTHQITIAQIYCCETILKINRMVLSKEECSKELAIKHALDTHELHIKDPYKCGQYSGVIVRDSDQIGKTNEGRIFHRFLV